MSRAVKSCLAAGLLLVLMSSVTAQARTVPRSYEGDTAQGHRMSVDLVRRDDGSFWIKRLVFRRLEVTCEIDQTVQLWSVEAFFGGRGEPLEGRTLTMDRSDQFNIFRLNAHFKALRASGALEYALPAFTGDGQLQACTTGVMPWSADRTVPQPAKQRSINTGGPVYQFRIGAGTFTFVRVG